jgi:hypothetical protein
MLKKVLIANGIRRRKDGALLDGVGCWFMVGSSILGPCGQVGVASCWIDGVLVYTTRLLDLLAFNGLARILAKKTRW